MSPSILRELNIGAWLVLPKKKHKKSKAKASEPTTSSADDSDDDEEDGSSEEDSEEEDSSSAEDSDEEDGSGDEESDEEEAGSSDESPKECVEQTPAKKAAKRGVRKSPGDNGISVGPSLEELWVKLDNSADNISAPLTLWNLTETVRQTITSTLALAEAQHVGCQWKSRINGVVKNVKNTSM